MSGTDRQEFLSGLSAEARNFAALQYDRTKRLVEFVPPECTEIEKMAEARARTSAFCRVASTFDMPYARVRFIGRVLSGRVLSEGEQRVAGCIWQLAVPTEQEKDEALAEAAREAVSHQDYLRARLGLSEDQGT